MQSEVWQRILKQPSSGGPLMVSFRLPPQKLSRSQWLSLAETAARTAGDPCCRWAAEQQRRSVVVRKAA
jgi:hypothetical protein